ncbi:MAG TPA: hypothetical protein VNT23_10435 [Gaiellaceae bacterium]|nr:hypothetical protein [Gaiellaceae bacterium]
MRLAAALCLIGCVTAAGCGSSPTLREEEPAPGSLEALWRAPGEDVAYVPGTADFGPGRVRVSFLVVDGQGRVVTRPSARVWVARALEAKPFAETIARAEPIGVDGDHDADADEIFVAHLELERPGKYWLLAEPIGGRKIQAIGNVVVAERPAAPAVGDRAIPSETPTLESTGGDLQRLTTQKPPDRALLQSSIAAALEAKAPFVVVFATPLYCQTRTCGPVVDVVSAVRQRHESSGIRFIHVEIHEDLDPAKGVNEWVKEWKLPAEPFTFLVGADGVIRERFEGTFSVRELDEAVRKHLLP